MCGIAGAFGTCARDEAVVRMLETQRHRGPDAEGERRFASKGAWLGHTRLSIIDLSSAGNQPMASPDGRYWIVFNGEIYNYVELRDELGDYPYRSQTDTEVVLAAFRRWGEGCLDRFVGMFAFLVWDEVERRLFAARDRFGVKPLYYHRGRDGSLMAASEIRALHAAGVPAVPDEIAWSTYLTRGLHDNSERTFWEGVRSLPPGHTLSWSDGVAHIRPWYDLSERIGDELDERANEEVEEEYLALLEDSVRKRFRSDVPVGINLSGGLDSSLLLGLVAGMRGGTEDVKAFTFVTGDPDYDEIYWVRKMLDSTDHESVACRIDSDEVPGLARSVQRHQDEPFGGLPTLAYARLFEQARELGTIVLLDGQGLDEQWAGYDYYEAAGGGSNGNLVQGTGSSPVRPACLDPSFRALAEGFESPRPFTDSLRNAQYRDLRYTKIPRALRFNDRVSMRASTELREPFLDHRLVELAFRQPRARKLGREGSKAMVRRLSRRLLPQVVVEAPKRPLQTPQREWLRGPLSSWATECIEQALVCFDGWFEAAALRREWLSYRTEESDNSFYVWQWIGLGLSADETARVNS